MLERLAGDGNRTGPGQGDVGRGPGDAPLFFGEKSDLENGRLEGVNNEDASRTLPGDLLGIGEAEHRDEGPDAGSTQGGAMSSPGGGGEAVWRDSLLPAEKRVLERYFQ